MNEPAPIPAGASARRKGWQQWLRLLQAIVTLALMVWLLRSIDWLAFWLLMSRARWLLIAAGVLVTLSIHVLNIMRWKYLLQEPRIGFQRLLPYYGAGLFSNNFLPTGIGGDGVRIALVSRDVPFIRAAFSVALDRGLGSLALGTLLIPGLWIGVPPGFDLPLLRGLSGASVLAIGVLGIAAIGAAVVGYQLPWVRAKVQQWKQRYSTGMDSLHRPWYQVLLGGFLISVVSNFTLVILHWLVLRAVFVDVSSGAAIWLVMIGSASLLLPVSVNGLGLFESVYVVLLGYYSVPASAALGVGLIIRILMLLFSLLGGLVAFNLRLDYRLKNP